MPFSEADFFNHSFNNRSKLDSNGKRSLQDLELRLNKLELIVEALWEILKKETNLQEADLMELIAEIDLQDGRFDGKKAKIPTIQCARCNRINSKRHSKCLYCGEVFLIEPFE